MTNKYTKMQRIYCASKFFVSVSKISFTIFDFISKAMLKTLQHSQLIYKIKIKSFK
jgi:hypothetical protein